MCKSFLKLACVLLLTVPDILAQSTSGTLAGKVTNASGTAIPNAAITVTNSTTKQSQKALTGPDGSFAIALPPGTYQIDVETQGYKHTTQQNVTLVAGPPESLTITMEAGPMSETVEIKGHAPAIQTIGGEVGMGVDTRTLQELPVIDRNPQQLVQLQTGITPPFPMSTNPPPVIPNWAVPAPPFVVNPDRSRFFSTNGQMPWNNLWELDGVMNLEPFRNTAVRVQPVPSVQQMNVETAVLGVPRGFVGGAQATSITPGGTNAFHGEAYEFWSGNPIRTRDFFSTGAVPDPRFVYNQPGVDGGGAIVHDKTFLFGDYEGTFTNGDSTSLTTVPTAAELGGNFSAIPGLTVFNPATGSITGAGRTPFAGNIIPGTSLNPATTALASLFPAANLPGTFNNFQTNTPFRNNQEKADGRLDEHFNDRTSAFLRYGYTNDWAGQGSPYGSSLGIAATDRLIAQNAIGDVTHAFSGSLITDFRFGYNRWQQTLGTGSNFALFGSGTPATSLDSLLGAGVALPSINVTGFAPIGTPADLPQYAVDNTFNWVWNWSWNHGRHNLKFGTDIRRIRSDGFTDSLLGQQFGPAGSALFTAGPTLTGTSAVAGTAPYNALASFLLGAPTQYGALSYLTTPTIRQTQYAAWVGDTIQVTHALSLDFGVRYDLFGAIEPRNGGGGMFYDPGFNTFNFAGVGGIGMNPYTTDTNDVAPRFGFAYRFNEKTVVRGGYGIQYFQAPYSLMGLMTASFGSVVGASSGLAVAPGFTPGFAAGLTTVPSGFGTANGVSAGNQPATLIPTHLDTPYVQNYSLQVQREFYYGSMLSVGYVGNVGRNLPFNEELNAALPGTGLLGLPYFTAFGRTASTAYFSNGVTSNYNSLQVSLTKRMAKGLSFVAAYTYSRALGYTNNLGTLLDPFNIRSNYGPLPFDCQSMLTISHLWELPFGKHGGMAAKLIGGWQVNGIFTYATGTPLTVTSDPATCACPGLTPLANAVGTPFSNVGLQVLNPNGFAPAPFGSFGDVNPGAVRSPGFTNYDLSLFKNFRIHDRYNVQLRGEAYNLFNTPHFAPAMGNVGLPDFGSQVATLTGFGRQINLGFRFMF